MFLAPKNTIEDTNQLCSLVRRKKDRQVRSAAKIQYTGPAQMFKLTFYIFYTIRSLVIGVS